MAQGRWVGRGGVIGYGPHVAVTASTSTGTKLKNYGVASFGATAAKTWNIEMPPKVGQRVTLYCSNASGTAIQTVDSTGGNVFQTANGQVGNIKFSKQYQSVELIGLTTALYQVVDANPAELPVVTVTSTATALPPWGMVLFGSTAAKTFTLAAPQPGKEVNLIQNYGSTLVRKVSLGASTVTNFFTTAGAAGNVVQFTRQHQFLRLMGQTTAIYRVLHASNTLTYSTS